MWALSPPPYLPQPPSPSHFPISLALTPHLHPQIRDIHPPRGCRHWLEEKGNPSILPFSPPPPPPQPRSCPSNLSRFSERRHGRQQGAEDTRGSCTRTAHRKRVTHTHTHARAHADIPASGGATAPSFHTGHDRDEAEAQKPPPVFKQLAALQMWWWWWRWRGGRGIRGGMPPPLCHPLELCCPLPHSCLIPGCT